MASRSGRAAIARQTIEILERGSYALAGGEEVSIAAPLRAAREGTRHYTPEDFHGLFRQRDAQLAVRSPHTTRFEVTNETTLGAARRLVNADETSGVVCLNFASAMNPGGGFLGGSRAQEESLARGTGLYACIAPMTGYYEENRRCGTALYTHHMIYSPGVPVFRDDDDELLAQPYCASFITSPAVNLGALRQNQPHQLSLAETVMRERIERVLTLALVHGHQILVLGAWGCGVFRNSPQDVARWFHEQLAASGKFVGAFRTIVFAVLDQSPELETYRPFAEAFGVEMR
jgi:uncharacterized protein (TIGR02452 family)